MHIECLAQQLAVNIIIALYLNSLIHSRLSDVWMMKQELVGGQENFEFKYIQKKPNL